MPLSLTYLGRFLLFLGIAVFLFFLRRLYLQEGRSKVYVYDYDLELGNRQSPQNPQAISAIAQVEPPEMEGSLVQASPEKCMHIKASSMHDLYSIAKLSPDLPQSQYTLTILGDSLRRKGFPEPPVHVNIMDCKQA